MDDFIKNDANETRCSRPPAGRGPLKTILRRVCSLGKNLARPALRRPKSFFPLLIRKLKNFRHDALNPGRLMKY